MPKNCNCLTRMPILLPINCRAVFFAFVLLRRFNSFGNRNVKFWSRFEWGFSVRFGRIELDSLFQFGFSPFYRFKRLFCVERFLVLFFLFKKNSTILSRSHRKKQKSNSSKNGIESILLMKKEVLRGKRRRVQSSAVETKVKNVLRFWKDEKKSLKRRRNEVSILLKLGFVCELLGFFRALA